MAEVSMVSYQWFVSEWFAVVARVNELPEVVCWHTDGGRYGTRRQGRVSVCHLQSDEQGVYLV